MATIDSKEIVDKLILGNGIYPDADEGEPAAVKIVGYINAWGNLTYGVVFEGEAAPNRYEVETDFVRNPQVIWEREVKS